MRIFNMLCSTIALLSLIGSITATPPSTVAERPYSSVIPTDYTPSETYPLVILLHGYTGNAAVNLNYFTGFPPSMTDYITSKQMLVATPQGSTEPATNTTYWNDVNGVCCDFFGSGVDDVGYIMNIIADMKSRYSVDNTRVYIFGHSNGAFLAYTIACTRSEYISGVIGFAGALNFPTTCSPSTPVNILAIHGTTDGTISYNGGDLGVPNWNGTYTSSPQTVAKWVSNDKCDTDSKNVIVQPKAFALMSPSFNDVTITTYNKCSRRTRVVQWKVENGTHVPQYWRIPMFDAFEPFILQNKKATICPPTTQPTTPIPTTKPPTTKTPTTKTPTTKPPTTKPPTTTNKPTLTPTKLPTVKLPTTKPSTTKKPY